MKARRRADLLGVARQLGAAGELSVFELLDRGEMPVDQHGVGQRPQVFGGLQLGRVRWQKEEMDVLGHAQLHAAVPASPVQDEHNLLGRTRAHLAGEGWDASSRMGMPNGHMAAQHGFESPTGNCL
jgi:hypothetical protein